MSSRSGSTGCGPAPTASSARRATYSAWWKLLAAASGGRSGQSVSVASSRCTPRSGASASSFTRLFAFRRRHALSGTIWSPTPTAKPPNIRMVKGASISAPCPVKAIRSHADRGRAAGRRDRGVLLRAPPQEQHHQRGEQPRALRDPGADPRSLHVLDLPLPERHGRRAGAALLGARLDRVAPRLGQLQLPELAQRAAVEVDRV